MSNAKSQRPSVMASPPPGMGPPQGMPLSPFGPGNFPNQQTPQSQEQKPIDYLNLPQPIKFEELTRESSTILKPDTFEGFRFNFTKPLNPNFFLTHAFNIGSVEMPVMQKEVIKTPVGTYELGTAVAKEGFVATGRLYNDGKMVSRLKYDVNDWLSVRLQSQFGNEPANANMMLDVDVQGKAWNGQMKLGSGEFIELNYVQSVTDKLAIGGEVFYLGANQRSGFSLALRHSDNNHATAVQLATTGLLVASYSGRVNEQLALASELVYNWNAREATTQVGYDYLMRHCRLKGRVDSNGTICAFLEERMNMAVSFILSGEVDYWRQNYKFGFGLTIGE
eukprot:TRINITY_DN924_c0_g1_i1.p1 TRINITY_DN924_c0_g1~~TRINITY_DN924_c0_g1_i1.p1  ORF type:complete len:336 (-),score=44.69 TRINITY_DN924_c0_g1_i1:514-1521(-)